MSDQKIFQSCETLPHGHSTTDGNLMLWGTKTENVKDALGMVIGFRKTKVYKCRVCTREIEKVDQEIFPLEEY